MRNLFLSPKNALAVVLLFTVPQIGFGQKIVDRRLNTLGVTKSALTKFQLARNEVTTGSNSLLSALEKMNDDLSKWNSSWVTLKIALDSAESSSIQVLEQSLATQASQLSTQLNQIANNGIVIKERCNYLIEELNSIEKLKYNPANFESEYALLSEGIVTLSKTLELIQAQSNETLDKLRNAVPHVQRALVARLRVRLSAQTIADLESVMVRIQSIFQSDEMVQKYLSPVKFSRVKLSSYLQNARYFKTKEQLEKFEQSCSGAIHGLGSENIDETIRKYTSDLVLQICSTSKVSAAKIINLGAGKVTASSIYDNRMPTAIEKCKQADQGRVNCNAIPWLSRFSRDDIEKMSELELKALEKAWDELEGAGL